MKLAYGFLCNYAAPGASNKPTAVGIFDALFIEGGKPILWPPCCLHGLVAATGEFSGKQVFDFELCDDDGAVIYSVTMATELSGGTDGLGLAGYLYLPVGGIELPDYGNYEFVLKAGGVRFAELPLYVRKVVAGQVARA